MSARAINRSVSTDALGSLPEWRSRAAETRRARSRQKIIAAAQHLFENFEFDDVSVEMVAEQAGVGPATIFQRFGTKGGLAAAVLAQKTANLQREAERDANAESLPLGDAVRRHLRRVARVITANRALARAVLAELSRSDGPPVDERDPRLILPLPEPLAYILAVGIDDGAFVVPTTAFDTAASITSMLMIRIMVRHESSNASADFVSDLVLNGISVR